MNSKIICKLDSHDENRITELTRQGMAIALIGSGIGFEKQRLIKNAVLNVFHALNQPIGLMLELTHNNIEKDLDFAKAEAFNFIIMDLDEASPEVFDAAVKAGLKLILHIKTKTESERIIACIPYAHGFCAETYEEGYAEAYACIKNRHRLLYFSRTAELPPDILYDGLLAEDGNIFPCSDIPKPAAGGNLSECLANLLQNADPAEVTAFNTATAAMSLNASAIVAMTADGENIDRLSRYCCNMPLIAVAARPKHEKLLLSLTGNYGVLPTAITKIPEDKNGKIAFAAFVAELYGYKKGDAIIVTGHWHDEANPNYTEILIL